MSPEKISLSTARNLMLSAQGLAQLPRRLAEKEDVLGAIRRMGALQIDTIHVVARSPYLVLWSRLGDYAPGWMSCWPRGRCLSIGRMLCASCRFLLAFVSDVFFVLMAMRKTHNALPGRR